MSGAVRDVLHEASGSEEDIALTNDDAAEIKLCPLLALPSL
jgi:hypothetical protein